MGKAVNPFCDHTLVSDRLIAFIYSTHDRREGKTKDSVREREKGYVCYTYLIHLGQSRRSIPVLNNPKAIGDNADSDDRVILAYICLPT